MTAAALVATACSGSSGHQSAPTSAAPQPSLPVPATTLPGSTTGSLPTTEKTAVLERITAALDQMAAHAYNPAAPANAKGGSPGGLYVNWRAGWNGADAAANTDINTDGLSDAQAAKAPRHDPLTDLYYLRNLYGYGAVGGSATRYRAQIAQMTPIVQAEFDDYGYYRGWVYFELLDLATAEPTGGWDTAAQNLAANISKRFWDPGVSAFADPSHDTFETDDAAESAAVLVDAGQRFSNPTWSTEGAEAAETIVRACADRSTGLFPLSFSVQGGSISVLNDQVTMGVEAQLLDALLDVYDHTRSTDLLTAVERAVTSLYSPGLGLYDPSDGGFFFSVDADGTALDRAYKETRQAWMIQLLQHLTRDGSDQSAELSSMVTLVTDKMWQPAAGGYVYRTAPDWTAYTDNDGPGHSRNVENYVSSEAMGIAVQALESAMGQT